MSVSIQLGRNTIDVVVAVLRLETVSAISAVVQFDHNLPLEWMRSQFEARTAASMTANSTPVKASSSASRA